MASAATQKAQQWDRASFDRVSKEAASKLRQLYRTASKPAPADKPLGTQAMVEKLMPMIREGIEKKIPLTAIAEHLDQAGVKVTPGYLRSIVRQAAPAEKKEATAAPAELPRVPGEGARETPPDVG
jgi:hypothetical protein